MRFGKHAGRAWRSKCWKDMRWRCAWDKNITTTAWPDSYVSRWDGSERYLFKNDKQEKRIHGAWYTVIQGPFLKKGQPSWLLLDQRHKGWGSTTYNENDQLTDSTYHKPMHLALSTGTDCSMLASTNVCLA